MQRESDVKRSYLFLFSVYALPWLIPERGAVETFTASFVAPPSAGMSAADRDAGDQASQGAEYYLDCKLAETKGDGHSPARAWHTLEEVNGHTFVPGEAIYLKRGTECHGFLWPKGSGSATAPIRLSAYGEGLRPRVIAGKNDEEAFKLFDQQYWDVDSIEFSGGTLFGVFVSGQTGTLHHIHVRNLLVHDVHGGEVKHKESGLVVISPGKVEQHFDDVLVDGVTAYGTEQWVGILVGGGNFGEVTEENWNTRVVVRNSVVHDVYGDGIILFRVKDGLIDGSVAWHTGMQPTQTIGTPNAIWTWMCENCVVSKNEAFLTDSPGVDGGAFDIDYGNTRNSVLDNYAHDTQGYCIAVFGAGYVTRESTVEGNLCINNGISPRLAEYQGAIFLWTWNDGVIENLLVQKNTVYWNPSGNFPPVLNRADIRGSRRIFRENQIYSGSPRMVESNKNINFQDNRYTGCGLAQVSWVFDSHAYGTLAEYRDRTGQEQGSEWKSDMPASSCLTGQRPQFRDRANAALADKSAAESRRIEQTTWTLASELPASVDTDGFLDAASAAQLVVLKNVETQFRASGLRVKVRLHVKRPSTGGSVANWIRDLGMSDLAVPEVTGSNALTRPETHLIAPDGSIAEEWRDFVGPAEIGLAVRRTLGQPSYSQMESEIQ
jgi:hypothetical protein